MHLAHLARPTSASLRRSLIVATIALLALVFGSQAAFGAVTLKQSGKRGARVVTDTMATPGANCYYDANVGGAQGNDLDIIEVNLPQLFARDRRPNRRDSQKVGVRAVVQRSKELGGSGGWVKARTLPKLKKTAFDDAAATFGTSSWTLPIDDDYHFRVIVDMYWYEPGQPDKVQGRAKVRYQYYRKFNAGPQGVELNRCLPEY